MAIVTLCRGRQVIKILAHGGDTIMTTGTGAEYLEVIDRNRGVPDVGTVTIFTDVGRADVIEALTSGRDTVMTIATALCRDVLVIKVGRQPAVTAMTVIALRRSGQMIKILAHGDNAVMTTGTGTKNLEVIDGYRRIP